MKSGSIARGDRRSYSELALIQRYVVDRLGCMGDLSPHFSTIEFACKCGQCDGRCSIDGKLIAALESLRTRAGSVPITILSGYRCSLHNQAVGGAGASQHMEGKAADIRIAGCSVQRMYQLAKTIDDFVNGGIGAYTDGHLHVDVRGTMARWSYHDGGYHPIGDLVQP